ncbi:hypothetical protein [Geobacter grbiciae]|uniref:hypothetical protein n=1 Tax=Geobacter grbiciae TaxID=155042 RepID=UPI001C00FE27|nr:hypothetical protein [Geobacter grbiciae]MBT1074410.1 hypothetical protein [Geobacter grbiciae]
MEPINEFRSPGKTNDPVDLDEMPARFESADSDPFMDRCFSYLHPLGEGCQINYLEGLMMHDAILSLLFQRDRVPRAIGRAALLLSQVC